MITRKAAQSKLNHNRERKKNMFKRISSLFLTLLLVVGFAFPAAADWTTYQGNNNHNGVITDGAPITTSVNTAMVNLTHNGSGWDGIDTAPVMQTLDNGDTYAYVIYDGYAVSGNNGGGRLAKVRANDAKEIWSKQLTLSAGFQLSTPLLVQGNDASSEADDTIYVGTTGFSQLLKNDELNGSPVTDWTVTGGVASGTGIDVAGNQVITLKQTDLALNNAATNRAALGIYIGNSADTNVTADVQVKVNGTTVVTKAFSKSSSDAQAKPIQDPANPGQYYYYLNDNFAAMVGDEVEYIIDVKNNADTVKVDYASLYQQTGSIQKVTGLDQTSPSNVSIVTGIAGQINTPITTDGTYLYFGTWTGKGGGTYYQVEIANPTNVKTATTGDYYWAGAVVSGDYVYFGSDEGKLHYRLVDDFANDGDSVIVPSSGKIRSSIAVKDDTLYFTSQNGYLWVYEINTFTGEPTLDWHKKLAATSTSTPVITANNIIYVGYYNGFSSGGVQAIDLSTKIIKNVTPPSFKPVQSSIIAHTENNIDYLYFTTNAANGAGYGYSFDGTTGNQVWNTEATSGKTYTLQGMAASNGYLVFGNDYNNLYIVK